MQVTFADRLPDGDYALVLPADRADTAAVKGLGEGVEAVLQRQRFEGDAASAVELFLAAGTRRLLVVGAGKGVAPAVAAEKLGGTVAAKLLTSGETHAAIDLTGLGFDADAAARLGLSAALRSWRYDRYRTKLKDKQKPTLTRLTIVGAGAGAHPEPCFAFRPLLPSVPLSTSRILPTNVDQGRVSSR